MRGRGRPLRGPAQPEGRLAKRRGEVWPSPSRGVGVKPRQLGGPRSAPAAALRLRPRGSSGRRRGGSGFATAPSGTVPAPAVACWSRTQLVRAKDPPLPTHPGPGDARWGKVCPVLTEDAVFLQGAVDLAVGVDLEVVLGGTVEFPAPGRSPEVLVDAAAAPRIPTRPGVAQGGSGGPGHPRGPPSGPRLLQRTQEQDPNYNHCGMMAAALSLLGRWRLGASGTRGPIKAVLLAALQSCRAHTVSSREALASFYQPRSGPFICLRFT